MGGKNPDQQILDHKKKGFDDESITVLRNIFDKKRYPKLYFFFFLQIINLQPQKNSVVSVTDAIRLKRPGIPPYS